VLKCIFIGAWVIEIWYAHKNLIRKVTNKLNNKGQILIELRNWVKLDKLIDLKSSINTAIVIVSCRVSLIFGFLRAFFNVCTILVQSEIYFL
jgi:glutaredoxin 2